MRKICTSGSVRGRLGNWPSYLDGVTRGIAVGQEETKEDR
jgi:hypothetical protein